MGILCPFERINIMAEYKRILLKLSGEAMSGDKGFGFDEDTCIAVAEQIKALVDKGIQVAIVTGGGNFWRGRSSKTIDRTKADSIGMLGTVMNCVYMSEICRYTGLQTSIYTPFNCGNVTELFSKDKAVADLNSGKVVFLAGGTGHPYFSTDTTTALRAIELECELIAMARAVDGVYDSDPKLNPDAVKFDRISYQEVLDRKLKILDLTATVMCMENGVSTLVFSLNEENGILNNLSGNITGTIVY